MFAHIGQYLIPVRNIQLVLENAETFEIHFWNGDQKPDVGFVEKSEFPSVTLENIRKHLRDVSQFGN